MKTSLAFLVESVATLGLIATPEIDRMYALSPYAWRDGDRYRMLLRLVNRADDPHDKVARIHAATSSDGVTFAIAQEPAIAPNAGGPDANGCEDPTVVANDRTLVVFYSGWSEATQQGTLLVAAGGAVDSLSKRGTAIVSSESYGNPKEATLVRCPSGDWTLFFEYARDDASKIAVARASDLFGTWTIDHTFAFPTRTDAWDSWHLSPGPIVALGSENPTMFYNGGNKDGAWRIGWATFDSDYTKIVERSAEPVIVPPPPAGDDADIAFVASAIVRDARTIDLYYSVADKICKRATLKVA